MGNKSEENLGTSCENKDIKKEQKNKRGKNIKNESEKQFKNQLKEDETDNKLTKEEKEYITNVI